MENGHSVWNLECDESLYITITGKTWKIINKTYISLSGSIGGHLGQGRHWKSKGLYFTFGNGDNNNDTGTLLL
jgi:hypothetical protein